MIAIVVTVLAYCLAFFITRHRLGLEVASLRQQLVVFKRKQSRPRLQLLDRIVLGCPSLLVVRMG